jgi:hypothetical protein
MENIEQQAIPSKNEQSYQNQSKNIPNNFQNQNIINQSQQILFKKQNERVKTKVINLIYNFQLLILFNIRMWQALKVIILKIIN